jgi:hypothetical protein
VLPVSASATNGMSPTNYSLRHAMLESLQLRLFWLKQSGFFLV